MARRVVPGGLRATCIPTCVREFPSLAALTARRAGRAIVAFFASDATSSSSSRHPMEPLEQRQLLAGITLNDGILSLSGPDGQRNTLTVTKNSSGNYVGTSNSITNTYAASAVNQIRITGGDDNDTIKVDTSITKPVWVDARYGDDSVSTGGGNDTVWGDNGNDSIYGNGGNDALHGEGGNDYVDGGSGTNVVDGGDGTDVLKNNGTGTSGTGSTGSSGSSGSSTSGTSTSSTLSVTAVELWNTDTNKKIENLDPGQTIDLGKLPAHLTLVAQGSSKVLSVKYGYDSNSNYRVESSRPWAINGDNNGKLTPFNFSTGSHKIVVTPYSRNGATGSAGAATTINFTVIRSSAASSPGGGGSGGSGGGGTGGNTGGSGGIVPRDASAASPNAIITAVSSSTIHAGQSFHAHAMTSSLGDGTPLTARYVWDFGDPGSAHNVMYGFNAAHRYNDSGTYTVKLTLTNESGKPDTATMTVNVQAAGRKKIYVSNDGSDSNSGLSPDKALRTFAKAALKVNDNTEVLFNGGDTFATTSSMTIYDRNVLIGSYGSGRATIKYTGGKDYTTMIYLGGQGNGEDVVENLIFDSIYTNTEAVDGIPQGVGSGGTGDAVVDCEFRNVGYAVNTSARPHGMLIQDNTAPLKTGLKEYFTWAEGSDLVIIGNTVANTLHGADVRSGGTDRLNISDNDFDNPVDSDGIARGTLTIHKGNYFYCANNTLSEGSVSAGPLNSGAALNDKGARLRWVVFEGNTVNDSVLGITHGTEHSIVRNNIVRRNNDQAYGIAGFDTAYGRGVIDCTFVNNTAINTGTKGNFIRVGGGVVGINLINNLYLAPNLYTGTASTAPVYVEDNNLDGFNKITGNVWPKASTDWYAQGGMNYVWPDWSDQSGYKTAAEWEAYGAVGKDYYEDASYNSAKAPSGSSQAASAGVVWAGVFTDKNGKIRSNSGSWTAGAIEV